MDTQRRTMKTPFTRTLILLMTLSAAAAHAHPGRVVAELIWLQAGEVDFGGIGHLDPANDPGPLTGQVDRFYDNGYVRVDSSGNNGGLSWYWGLDDDQGVAPPSIDLYSYQAEADKYVRMDGDPDAPGIGIKYLKPLRIKEATQLQLLLAARFAQFDFADNSRLSGRARLLKDSYYTNEIILPQVPYAGGFEGPGPLIDSEPFRRRVDVASFEAETVGSRKLSGDLMALRLGITFERALNERTFVSLQFGYEALRIDGTLSYDETTTLSINGHSGSASGSRSRSFTDAGAFFSGTVTRDLTERLTLEASFGFSDHDPFAIQDGRHSVRWDLAEMTDIAVGLGYRF